MIQETNKNDKKKGKGKRRTAKEKGETNQKTTKEKDKSASGRHFAIDVGLNGGDA